MGNSINLENAFVEHLAERINAARKLYGSDSAYVIGLITAIEWIVEEADGGDAVRQALHRRIDSVIAPTTGGPVPSRPEREHREVPAAAGAADSLAENTWIKGAVKWFNNDKGYGFISTDSQVDVFVHWRDISSWDRSLVQGDEVEFMVTRTAKGYQAINVMKVGGEEQSEGESDSGESSDFVQDDVMGVRGEEEETTKVEGRDDGASEEAPQANDEENVY